MTSDQIMSYLRSVGVDPSIFPSVLNSSDVFAGQESAPSYSGDYGGTPGDDYQNVGLSQLQQNLNQYSGNLAYMPRYRLNAGQFGTNDPNYGILLQDDPNSPFYLRVKSADKEAVNIPYKLNAQGQYVPDWEKAGTGVWDTNAAKNQNTIAGIASILALGGAGLGAAGAFGAGAAGAGGAATEVAPSLLGDLTPVAGTAGYGATPGIEGLLTGAGTGVGGGAAESMWPGLENTLPGYTDLVSGAAPNVSGSLEGGLGGMLGGFGDTTSLIPDVAAGLNELSPPAAPTSEAPYPEWGSYEPPAVETPLPTIPGQTPWWQGGIGSIAEHLGDWALTNPEKALTIAGTIGSIIEGANQNNDGGGAGSGGTGWKGPISNFNAVQTYTPAPENYRPGFSPEHVYMQTTYGAGNPQNPVMNQGVAAALPPAPPPNIPPIQNPYIAIDPSSAFPEDRAGIGALPKSKAVGYAAGGMTKGPGDGMSDHIPATIEGQQPAVLSTDEFVFPADVVSHLGNGSSEAGAKVLYAMMDRIRQARTGSKSQAREINPAKFLP